MPPFIYTKTTATVASQSAVTFSNEWRAGFKGWLFHQLYAK